jgi:hypothetical protein
MKCIIKINNLRAFNTWSVDAPRWTEQNTAGMEPRQEKIANQLQKSRLHVSTTLVGYAVSVSKAEKSSQYSNLVKFGKMRVLWQTRLRYTFPCISSGVNVKVCRINTCVCIMYLNSDVVVGRGKRFIDCGITDRLIDRWIEAHAESFVLNFNLNVQRVARRCGAPCFELHLALVAFWVTLPSLGLAGFRLFLQPTKKSYAISRVGLWIS